jgi:hypothetical protein
VFLGFFQGFTSLFLGVWCCWGVAEDVWAESYVLRLYEEVMRLWGEGFIDRVGRLYGVRLRFYKYRFTTERKRRCLENYHIRRGLLKKPPTTPYYIPLVYVYISGCSI